MKASNACLEMIADFEGFSARPYKCPAGVWTIGIGSTRDADGKPITEDHIPITREQAFNLMLNTLGQYEDAVTRYVTVAINHNQFDALVDFAYNAGAQNLRTSTLLKKLNAGMIQGAADELSKWVYADGRILPGLVKRRIAERTLFLS